MMNRTFLGIFILFSALKMEAQTSIADILHRHNSEDVPYISVEELRMNQFDDEVVILDAREPEEFQVSHLKNAEYAGYNNFSIDNLKGISKDAEIVVYCSLGIRSEDIAQKLRKAGFKNVQNLYGGIFNWKNKGYPVYDLKGKETNKVHAYSEKWSKYLNNAEKIY